MKWQQIGNRKSASQNNICNRDKISAEWKEQGYQKQAGGHLKNPV